MSCYNCKAKSLCSVAVEEGSFLCMANRLKYGGTHADEEASRQTGSYCQYCGKHLKIIGTERFCNNPRCVHRYENV